MKIMNSYPVVHYDRIFYSLVYFPGAVFGLLLKLPMAAESRADYAAHADYVRITVPQSNHPFPHCDNR
ncbi:MAG: hypothetical protein WD059_15085 [Balneolaceae bacterium]